MDFKEDLIYRILAGEASEEEELACRKRIAEDEAERQEFERIERIWYKGKYAGKWESIDEEKAFRRLENGRTHRIRLKKSCTGILQPSGYSYWVPDCSLYLKPGLPGLSPWQK